MEHISIIVFSYAWLYQNSSFRGLQNPTMKISFIQVWSPAECEPQGDYYCKENPKCYHRTVKSSSPIESWRNNHSFNNDLLLGHCCCLNCLNCISIWPSIWPNPYFNVFHHQEYESVPNGRNFFFTMDVAPRRASNHEPLHGNYGNKKLLIAGDGQLHANLR